MDFRRYYVLSSTGELGPYRLADLEEALQSGTVDGTDQVRNGWGVVLGSVAHVVEAPGTPLQQGGFIGATSTMLPSVGGPLARRIRHAALGLLLLVIVVALTTTLARGDGAPPAIQAARPRMDPVPSAGSAPASPQSVAQTRPDQPRPTVPQVPRLRVDEHTSPDAATGANRSAPITVEQDATGTLVLGAEKADLSNIRTRLYGKGTAAPYIGGWNDRVGFVAWNLRVVRPGRFRITLAYACAPSGAGAAYTLKVGSTALVGTVQTTGSWDTYSSFVLAEVRIAEAGECAVAMMASGSKTGTALMKLRAITLTPVP